MSLPRLSSPGFIALLLMILFLSAQHASALGQEKYVTTAPASGSLSLVSAGQAATIYADSAEFPGVIRAAHDLQADIERVTGVTPAFTSDSSALKGNVVIIGTIAHNKLIDRLIAEHKLDASPISGKWESTLTAVVDKPFKGVSRALVIVGSDKRGSIFGIYDLSEQIGVSPWYWWADVPVAHRDALYLSPGSHIEGPPAVKYRGIFLNDEAPALTGWVNATYGGYNHKFYVKVFELLLRLRANYLWPAMWGSAFNEDDPDNARLADEYGIVMGTSHHEPMLRAQQEWKRHGNNIWDYSTNKDVLDKFWNDGIERNKNFESTITLGMRGDGDMPMSEGANIALLEHIVADQRNILAEHNTPTLAANPKVWALYKEVQEYYEKGMRVPDDITLLWCDDNWGNIRRLPTPEERKRPGGAGIYYHFDYVGDPRNYKWINTNPIAKVWEQMNLALNYGADRIWIVNVGDLKPMEFPIEYFLSLARRPGRWGKDQTLEFTRLWAEREFGNTYANDIAELITRYTQYNGRRKPELLDTDTFSFENYREADRVEQEWIDLAAKADNIAARLPANTQDAFFELVLYPLKASAIVNQLYITAGRNRLYARQGRADANDLADKARALFKADADLSYTYNHRLAEGKWNHMMDQTHLGYTFWNEPPLNTMPAVTEVQPANDARMGIAAEGAASSTGPFHLSFNAISNKSHLISIFNRGLQSFTYTATATEPWVILSQSGGEVSKESRLTVSIDWSKAPFGTSKADIEVTQLKGAGIPVTIDAFRPMPDIAAAIAASRGSFVESDGYLSFEAEHFVESAPTPLARWDRIPEYGATLSGMEVFPVTSHSVEATEERPSLAYHLYLFNSGEYHLQFTTGPTLNFVPGRGLRLTIALDDQPPHIIDTLEHNSEKDWSRVVSDQVRRVETTVNVAAPGPHTLRIGMIDPGLVLEKFVLSKDSLKASYLGPPESYRVPLVQSVQFAP